MTYRILCACALCAAMPAVAANLADTLELKTVEVVSTAKAPVTLLPLDVTTVGSKTFTESAETSILPVIQNHVPGMFVTERAMGGYGISGGGSGTVNIRGVGGGNKVLFMIDGQPQWAGIFGHALPDTYTSSEVDHVEVVSGPSSLLYGSNAMGGSVNIVTRRATKDGFSGSARAMWGSYSTQKYGLNLGYKHKGFNAYASATYESSHNNRPGMEYWLASQFGSLQYTFSRHWQAGANITLTESTPHNPGSVYEPLEDMWTRFFRATASVYVKNHYKNSTGGIQAFANWGRHTINDGHAPDAAPRDYLFHSHDYNMGVTAYQTIKPWTANDLSVGVDFKHWGGYSWNEKMEPRTEPAPYIVNRHVNEIAGYVMMQQGFFGDRLSVNGGVRLEHSSQFGNQWVPQAGFIFHPIESNTIKFSYGKGFRSPNLRELYLYAPANPDLKPEYLDNFEVELRQYFLNNRLNLGLSLYYIKGKDMIQTGMVDGRPMNMNTGSFINKGFEVDARFEVSPVLTIDANYAYLHTDAAILAAPKNKLFGEVIYHPGQWQFSVESMSIWGLYTQTGSKAEKQDYSLLNARAAYKVVSSPASCTLFVKGENLTNKKYEINYGFPMPGATVMAGFEINF